MTESFFAYCIPGSADGTPPDCRPAPTTKEAHRETDGLRDSRLRRGGAATFDRS